MRDRAQFQARDRLAVPDTLGSAVAVAAFREMSESGAPEVLVVEDDPSIRRLVVAAFKRQGLSVATAIDGMEAIERLRDHHFRVLLLDLMMPRVSGWEVIDWLKEDGRRKPQSVIVVSAANREVFGELEPGVVNAIVFKPFDVAELTAYVKACCGPTRRDRRVKRMIGAAP